MRRAIIGVILAVLVPVFCRADDRDSVSVAERLQEITRKVEEESKLVKEVAARYSSLERELKELKVAIADLKKREAESSQSLASATERRQESEREIEVTERKIQRIEEISRKRLRALYMHRPTQVVLTLSDRSTDADALLRQAYFLGKVSSFDRNLLAQLKKLGAERARQRTELDAAIQEQTALRASPAEQRTELGEQLSKQEELAKSLKAEKARKESGLTALKAQALRLESVITLLTNGEGAEGARQKSAKSAERSRPSKAFSGEGLSKGGKLVPPVDGKIVHSFGQARSEEFRNLVSANGIDYQAKPGSTVKAIAPGQVIHLGQMPVYGNIVILDHGKRYYTLYGRLEKIRVERGDVIASGETMAVTGSGEPNFYFEIRRNGEPVNPLLYLRK